MLTKSSAAIDDLYKVDGKAELVNGEILLMPPTGDYPGLAGGVIFASLLEYARKTKAGHAYPDNVAFKVDLPDRGSFSPDAAFYTGPRTGMRFLDGPPDFAVEVRSENDYDRSVDRAIAKKRVDYFDAGTKVVWDVDLIGPEVIRSYTSDDVEHPNIYRRGDIANAEPAVPGWKFRVDELYE